MHGMMGREAGSIVCVIATLGRLFVHGKGRVGLRGSEVVSSGVFVWVGLCALMHS